VSVQIIPVLKDHYRAGFSRPLLWFDAFLLFMIVVDICRFYGSGLSVTAALWLRGAQMPSSLIWDALRLLLFLMVILPVLIAFVRIVGWFGDFWGGPLAKSQSHVLIVHCMMCFVLIYFLSVTRNMQVLSGITQVETGHKFIFNSYFYSLLITSEFLKAVFNSMGGLVTASFAALIGFAVHGKELAEPVKHYLARAALADLPAELLRIRTPGRFEVPRAGNPVRVKFVEDACERVLREYQKLSPDSPKAIRYLDQEVEKCKQTILSQLVQSSSNSALTQNDRLSLGFFVGTRRAFEAALARIPRPRVIVTSPFASPSLLTLLRWQAFMTGDELNIIEFRPEDHFRPWKEQESRILEKICSLKPGAPRSLVFIVSEVFYASGRRVPLSDFLSNLETAVTESRIHVIVDGTNAVGNRCLVAADAHWDGYVFSPQRWLMAPEACGVLLLRNDLNGNGPVPPGLWEIGKRMTDVRVRTLAGLAGAMDLMRERGIEYFFLRCERLKKEFRLSLPETVQVVGDQSGLDETFILSCCPELGHKWRFDNATELDNEVTSKSVKASVLTLDPRQPWLRMTIPFYLDARELNRLCAFLEETTK